MRNVLSLCSSNRGEHVLNDYNVFDDLNVIKGFIKDHYFPPYLVKVLIRNGEIVRVLGVE